LSEIYFSASTGIVNISSNPGRAFNWPNTKSTIVFEFEDKASAIANTNSDACSSVTLKVVFVPFVVSNLANAESAVFSTNFARFITVLTTCSPVNAKLASFASSPYFKSITFPNSSCSNNLLSMSFCSTTSTPIIG